VGLATSHTSGREVVMQQFSVCPGCGRLVSTRYPFTHHSGKNPMVFCLASCFVRWDREQRWRQHQTAMDSSRAPRQGTVPPRAFDGQGEMHPAQAA
jgi:hypothetical protein